MSIPQPVPQPPTRRRGRWLAFTGGALVIALGSGAIGFVVGQSDDDTDTTTATASEPEPVTEADDTTPSPDASKMTRSMPKPEAPPVSDRGLLITNVGQRAHLGDENDPIAHFTIEAIEVDPGCNSDYGEEPPENGHFIVATITATVAPNFTEVAEDRGLYATGLPFNQSSFGLVDADGVVVNAPDTYAAFACIPDAEMIPNEVTDGQTATGKIVLDSPTPTGVLTYEPMFMDPSMSGWEWEF